jgi:hypothetical protein
MTSQVVNFVQNGGGDFATNKPVGDRDLRRMKTCIFEIIWQSLSHAKPFRRGSNLVMFASF